MKEACERLANYTLCQRRRATSIMKHPLRGRPRSSGDIFFDKERYLQQQVLDSDQHAVLRIQLDTLQDAFSKFSPSHYEELDEDLASHIDTLVYPIPLKYPLLFEFQTASSTPAQEETLAQVLKTYYCLRRADKVLDLRINMVKTFALFTLGAILLSFSYVLASSGNGSFFPEFMNIAGTFSLWECVNMILLERRDIQLEKRNAEQTASASIRFQYVI